MNKKNTKSVPLRLNKIRELLPERQKSEKGTNYGNSSADTASMELDNTEHRASTNRSRKSLFQDSLPWSREKTRPVQPYWDHKYETPFNPPPNEVNFMGGLGLKRGNKRSKIHPNRPTNVQKLLSMRTSNRILTTFGEPPQDANCCVREKISPKQIRSAQLRNIVRDVQMADNYDTPTPGSESSTPRDLPPFKRPIRKHSLFYDKNKIIEHQKQKDLVYFYDKDEIKDIAKSIIDKGLMAEKTPAYEFDNEDKTFREWAKELRAKFKAKKKTEVASDENPTESHCAADDNKEHAKLKATGEKKPKIKNRVTKQAQIKKLGTYLYGPFARKKTLDPLTKDESKFAIPNTMLERYDTDYKKRKIKKQALRKARLDHMGLLMPPSGEYSSDESVEEIKTLALIRTPYFIIPRIKTQKQKKTDRFKNEFLQRDGLRRITMLLYDRTFAAKKDKKTTNTEQSRFVIPGPRKSMKKIATRVRHSLMFRPTPSKQKYIKYIEEQYARQKKIYDDKYQTHRQRITFEEFKYFEKCEGKPSNDTTETNDQTTGIDKKLKAIVRLRDLNKIKRPTPVFTGRKINRSSRYDDYIGPFYTDPALMDKFRSPWKNKQESKYYTSLIRGRFGVRNRLQVNAPPFDDEKLGEKDKYLHRLATEWDNYYVNELRHRPRTRKYCPKTDTIFFRETTRKKYIKYYIQENLLSLIKQQKIEQKCMDEFEKFAQNCEDLFLQKKSAAHNKAMLKMAELNPLKVKTDEMQREHTELQRVYENLTEHIIVMKEVLFERSKKQNYYFLLMDTEWRSKHDHIHRYQDGQLKTPIEAMQEKAFKIPKTALTGQAIMLYFEEKVAPILDKLTVTELETKPILVGILNLKLKAFTYLTQHNVTLWFFETFTFYHTTLMKNFKDAFEEKRKRIEFEKKKVCFLEERNYLLEYDARQITKKPLAKSIKNPNIRKISAICDQLYLTIVPEEQHNDEAVKDMTVIDKFVAIQEKLMGLLGEMDDLPLNILKTTEVQVRRDQKRKLKEASKAMIKQNQFDILKRQLKFHFNLIKVRKNKR